MTEEVVLYPPQEIASDRAAILKRAPILGTRGSGKTLTVLMAYIKALPDWKERTRHVPVVILCRTNAMPTWYTQIQKWLNVPMFEIGVAHDSPHKRARMWAQALKGAYRFVITTPRSFLNDVKSGHIPAGLDLIWDEYHHEARNRTATWEAICTFALRSEIVFPTTGSPMREGPQDMFPILHLCNRKMFPSYWRYVKIWCNTMTTQFGEEIIGAKNMENFKKEIYGKYTGYMPKSETDKYLPKKERQFIPIEPSAFQQKQITKLYEQAYIELSSGRIELVPSVMVKILRERQILVCPKLIDPTWEWGAGVESLIAELEDLDTRRPVVFTDFADAVPLIAEHLRQKLGRRVHELRGGMKPQELLMRVEAHNKSEDDITVCSQQYAESFEFPRSETCYTLGFNWSPDVCEQAEDRLRRAISESNNIKCFYFQYLGTVDGDILERLRHKARTVNSVTPEEIHHIIRRIRGNSN